MPLSATVTVLIMFPLSCLLCCHLVTDYHHLFPPLPPFSSQGLSDRPTTTTLFVMSRLRAAEHAPRVCAMPQSSSEYFVIPPLRLRRLCLGMWRNLDNKTAFQLGFLSRSFLCYDNLAEHTSLQYFTWPSNSTQKSFRAPIAHPVRLIQGHSLSE